MTDKDLNRANKLMQEAIELYGKKEFDEGSKRIKLANNILDRYRKSATVSESTSPNDVYGDNLSFGIIQHIFESNIPELYEDSLGKGIMKKYIKTIKGDKNLLEQFTFYHNIMNVNNVSDIKEFVEEAINIIPKIDEKPLLESNQKLVNLIRENGLDESAPLNEEMKSLYDSIDFLLTNKKNIKNVSSFVNAKNNIKEYIERHIEDNNSKNLEEEIIKNTKPNYDEVQKCLKENKYDIIRSIADEQYRIREERMKGIFNQCRDEAISSINEAIESCDDESLKERLSAIKEKLENKEFDKNNLSKDIAEMMNIKDTLKGE